MKVSEIKGLPVIDMADAERLGTVSRVYLDLAARRVVGFSYEASGGFLQPERAPKVDMVNVHSLGPGAIILESKQSALGDEIDEHYGELVEADALAHFPLLTVDGRLLGKLAALEFDPQTFAITAIEASHGRFSHNETVAIDQIATIGPDYVIVTSATEPPVEASDSETRAAADNDVETQEPITPHAATN